MIREKDIAKQIGFSKQTVSAVLSGRWRERRICTKTRDQVLAIAGQMGYVPHHAARRLARARSFHKSASFDQVGLISLVKADEVMDPVCHSIMGGAELELSKLHASLTFVRVTGTDDWWKIERLARASGVDGWLLYGAVNDEAVNRLKSGGLPYVIMADHRCTAPVHSVNIDNVAVGRLAVEHLALLGHRRIGFFALGLYFLHQQETLAGFRVARKELELDDSDRRVLPNSVDGIEDDFLKERFIIEWLRNSDLTALFTSGPNSASTLVRLMKSIDGRPLEVPKDVSLVGSEIPSPGVRERNFTRIELPLAEVGRAGVRLLHRLVSQGDIEPGPELVQPTLIEGWSTSAPHTVTRDGIN